MLGFFGILHIDSNIQKPYFSKENFVIATHNVNLTDYKPEIYP
jgi:hypothetical protein